MKQLLHKLQQMTAFMKQLHEIAIEFFLFQKKNVLHLIINNISMEVIKFIFLI